MIVNLHFTQIEEMLLFTVLTNLYGCACRCLNVGAPEMISKSSTGKLPHLGHRCRGSRPCTPGAKSFASPRHSNTEQCSDPYTGELSFPEHTHSHIESRPKGPYSCPHPRIAHYQSAGCKSNTSLNTLLTFSQHIL